MGSARCSIAGDTNTASSSGYGTKQPLEALPIYASENLPTDTKKIESMEEPAAAAAGAATEHSQDDSVAEMEAQNFSEHRVA